MPAALLLLPVRPAGLINAHTLLILFPLRPLTRFLCRLDVSDSVIPGALSISLCYPGDLVLPELRAAAAGKAGKRAFFLAAAYRFLRSAGLLQAFT